MIRLTVSHVELVQEFFRVLPSADVEEADFGVRAGGRDGALVGEKPKPPMDQRRACFSQG